MFKKILWFVLIILVLYIVFVFVSPSNADKIGEVLGIKHFNETIRNIKGKADDIYTNLPSEEEWKTGIENIKNETISGAYIIKDGVDNIRENLNNTVDKYGEIKDKVSETKDQIESGIDIIKSLSGAINN